MELKSNGLNSEEMKKIVNQVTLDTIKEEKLPPSIHVHPLCNLQFYNTAFFKKAFKLSKFKQKVQLVKDTLNCLGINSQDEIYIFLTSHIRKSIMDKIKNKDPHQLLNLLNTVYHEIGHSYQKIKTKKYSYFERLCIIFIENYIHANNNNHYNQYHDDYLKEIDASIYGINKTEKFLKDNNLYEQEKDEIKRRKIIYQFRRKNYDFDKFWEELYRIHSSKKEDNMNYPLEILINIFLKPNSNRFKSIREIYQNDKFQVLDREMFCSILTSKPYLEQLNINELDEKEIELMKQVANYKIKKELSIIEYNEKVKKEKIIEESIIEETMNKNKKKLKRYNNLLSELELRNIELLIEKPKIRR